MNFGVNVQIDSTVAEMLNKISGGLPEAARKIALGVLSTVAMEVSDNAQSGRPYLNRGYGVLSDAWKLSASGQHNINSELRVESTTDGVEVSFAPDLPYTWIHDTGGEITPKNSQYLAIPLGNFGGLGPRAFGDLFVIRTKNNNLLLARRTRNKALEFLFVLKKRVEIPARHYISDAIAVASETATYVGVGVLNDLIREATSG